MKIQALQALVKQGETDWGHRLSKLIILSKEPIPGVNAIPMPRLTLLPSSLNASCNLGGLPVCDFAIANRALPLWIGRFSTIYYYTCLRNSLEIVWSPNRVVQLPLLTQVLPGRFEALNPLHRRGLWWHERGARYPEGRAD